MSAALYVGNLPFDVNPSELRAWFEQCGEVKDVRLVEPGESGRARGFAVVIMHLESSAALAIQRLDGSILEGRALSVTRMEGRALAWGGAPVKERPKLDDSTSAFIGSERRSEAAKARALVRVQQQFRERTNMTYELDCSGTPLVVRVFFPAGDRPVESRWRVDAHTLPGSPVSSASASSRALALELLARSWHDQDAERVPTKLDWDGVVSAMAAVRAI